MFMNVAYLTSVPVHPFTLYFIVVVCNPYLGVIVLSLFLLHFVSSRAKNVTLRCCASWSFISTIHSSIFMCSLGGREMFKSRKVNSPAQVPQLTIRQLENLAAERKRQSQRRRKKAKDRRKDKAKAKTHRAERKRTIESNFSLWLNWAASPDSLVHTWTLSGSNWAFAFRAFSLFEIALPSACRAPRGS